MLEEGKISTRQVTLLLFCLLTSFLYYSLPQMTISKIKQDAWLALLVTFVVDAALAVIFYVLGLRYPNQTMVQYSETILGPWLGKLIGLSFVLFFAGSLLLQLLVMSNFLYTALMPETPVIVFSLIILLVSAYAVNAGLEVIARLSEIIGPIMLISLLVVFFLNLNRVELAKLFPMFQHSAAEVFKASLLPVSLFGICIVMGMLMAYHNIPKENLKAKWIAITMGTLLAILIYLQLVTVLGVNMSSIQRYPVYRLVKMIEIGDFFERIEPLMVIFWVGGSFIAVSILYYNSVLGLAQVLKMQRYQPLTPLVGGGILLASVISFRNVTEMTRFTEGVFPYLALVVEDLLMTLLFTVSYIRHGKSRNSQKRGRNNQ